MLHEICIAESGASEEQLRTCLDGTVPTAPAAKCYIHCLFDKIDVVDEATGRILLDRLLYIIPDDVKAAVDHLTRECSHIGK